MSPNNRSTGDAPSANRLRRRLVLSGAPAFALLPVSAWSQAVPAERRVLAVYGDSQGQGLAAALLAATRGSPIHVINRTKAGSALGQPVTYDWVSILGKSVEEDHPAIAVMMFGGNDRVPAHLPDGRALPFRGDAWLAFYQDRLHQLLAPLVAAGTLIVWCGDPATRDERYAKDMAYLNDLYQQALPKTNATFVDIRAVAAGPGGAYAAYGPGVDGVVQRLRTDDGIHFTPAGYGLVAQKVLRAISDMATQKPDPAAHATTGHAPHQEF